MNLSMKWLQEFVTVTETPREFADAMTMSGSKVESWKLEGAEIEKVVTGQILSITKHQDSDHLVICQVDVGQEEPLQIVTGASNLTVGDIVPVALHGSKLPGGISIKKGKLRGVESNGMLCSLGELGLTINDFPNAIEDGIFVLDEVVPLGKPICEVIGFDDVKVEFEITSNRPDCFSVIGLAREAAATFDRPLKLHTPEVKGGHGSCKEMLDVEIAEPNLCSIYSAKIVKNVRVKPSPRWMRERLRAMGVRPINNIVDITNYVMLEYGQPMHAFDLRFIEEGKIRVRLAKAGEIITTLDGVERTLSTNQLVIADANKPVAIAGVMGGEYSGILDDTTTIVFESACFDAASVRTTARDQGMRTDASSRYEKGLDFHNCLPALQRACELVELLDAGDVLDDVIVDNKAVEHPVKIPLQAEWINRFLALDLSEDAMKTTLAKLGCTFEGDLICVPSYRPDLQHKADIAEEIARFYGYNKMPSSIIAGNAQGKYTQRQKFDQKINQTMLALGFSEAMTYSFLGEKDYDKFRLPKDNPHRKSVTILNPLGEDTALMRTTALPSLFEALSRNYNNRNENVALYELAREYIPVEGQELPNEITALVAGVYGEMADFFTVKGAIETLFHTLAIENVTYVPAPDAFAFHPGRVARIFQGDTILGVLGELHPEVQENYKIGSRVVAVKLFADTLFAVSAKEKKYQPLPKFPAVTRDLAMLCDETIPVHTLEVAIRKGAGKYLETVKLFDIYQGSQIEAGKKSVAFAITLRSSEGTLTDEISAKIMTNIIAELAQVGAVLRT